MHALLTKTYNILTKIMCVQAKLIQFINWHYDKVVFIIQKFIGLFLDIQYFKLLIKNSSSQ